MHVAERLAEIHISQGKSTFDKDDEPPRVIDSALAALRDLGAGMPPAKVLENVMAGAATRYSSRESAGKGAKHRKGRHQSLQKGDKG
mmetsp:Transcript_68878/g.158207  ORF Transcript_68878/g.158207 Transcript_68878/m.158207 type:complete len:87 (-) Transcript_68878:97-357(-)